MMELRGVEELPKRIPVPIRNLKFKSGPVRVTYFGKLTAISRFEFPDTTFSPDQDNRLFAWLDCQKLVLDFSNVDFLSSAMLGKLISINRKMKEKGGILRLCGVCPNIRLIFKYTDLETILDIRDSQSDAVEA